MLSGRRTVGALAAAAGLLAAAWNALYISILWHEGEGDLQRADVRYLAASVGIVAIVLVVTFLFRSPTVRVTTLAMSAAALTGIAVIASLSIGILLAPAALLAWLALGRERAAGSAPQRVATLGFVIGAAIPLVFLLVLAAY
jgi:hypothetical protein